ncbi:glycosyltransferase family 4 protein [Calderihabitans maritimus]|uniref:Glycosyltransferase n=1 Tax=Calderihabitans maritimus TaxID=1246530 RepID=A0A1Z5HUU9_9FIRM|nr:glycosyltransferase family 4 protein [Calderihabitans maritimus]GAW93292.1 glycosyltransferase [Calderihabitans maritimus]
MDIWIINHYAVPPQVSGGTRHYDFGTELACRGHRVVLWLSTFNHHQRRFLSPAERQRAEEKSPPNLELKWIWSYPHRGNDWRRVLNMFTFSLLLLWHGMFRRKPDVILASSPHLLAPIAGWVLSLLGPSRFILEVRDLWPDALVAMGLRNRPAIWLMRKMELFLYYRSQKIIVLSEGIRERLIARGISPDRVILIPNGVYLERYRILHSPETVRHTFGFNGRFVCLYAGAIGPINGLEVVIKAAWLLRESPDFLFVLAGDGPERKRLEKMACEYSLANVKFLGSLSKEVLPSLLNAADVLLACSAPVELFRMVRPNKLFDYLAVGRPIVSNIDGETRKIIEDTGVGRHVRKDDPQAMVEGILYYYRHPEEYERVRENAWKFLRDHGDRRQHALLLEKVLCEPNHSSQEPSPA